MASVAALLGVGVLMGGTAQAWSSASGLAGHLAWFGGVAILVCLIAAALARRQGQGEAPPAPDDLGGYELLRKLGSGGMGEVWEARHRLLARPAAVKLIRPEALLGEDPARHGLVEKRFCREATVTASLRCPHTVALYDFGRGRGSSFYYVMELLEGMDLRRLVERFGPMDPARVVSILGQVCRSLDEAHHLQMVHRDIKPDNLYVCRLGTDYDFVKVLDFGLVKDNRVQGQGTPLTAVGTVYGTPGFMAPEQVMGLSLDGRADLYALGCVGYWILTGRQVFEGTSMMQVAMAHIQEAPVPPSARVATPIPAELERILLCCLEKKADDRPQTAAELREMLAACPMERPWTAARACAWWLEHLPEYAGLSSPGPARGDWSLEQDRAAVVELLGD